METQMTMTMAQAGKVLGLVADAWLAGGCAEPPRPAILTGLPGLGKTSILHQAAERAGIDIYVMKPATHSKEKAEGCPVPNRETLVTDEFPFEVYARVLHADRPLMVILDDLGAADVGVQLALSQLVGERRIGNLPISKNVWFVATTNRRSDKSGVMGIINMLMTRFVLRLQVRSDFWSWARWYVKQRNFVPEALAFFQWNPQYFCDEYFVKQISLDPEKPSANPRTVTYMLDNHAMLKGMNGALGAGESRGIKLSILSNNVGQEIAISWLAFCEIVDGLPGPDEFLKRPDTATLFRDSEVDKRWAVVSMLLGRTAKAYDKNDAQRVTEFDSACRYVRRFPMTLQAFWFTSVKDVNAATCETKAYRDWVIENQDVMQ